MSRFTNLGDLDTENRLGRIAAEQQSMADIPLGLCDHIYYGESSTMFREACDVIRSLKFVQSFTSLSTNGSATLQIPNVSIIDQVFMQVSLPSWPANVYGIRGLLLAMIDRIEYQLGASTRYVLDGRAHLQYLLEQASTDSQKDAVLRLAGESLINSSASEIVMQCPIALPFTRGLYGDKKHPFDAKMLSMPILITVYFNSAGLAGVCGGSGVASLPTSWSSGLFAVSQIDFKSPENSLARDLQMTMGSYLQPALFIQPSISLPLTGSSVKTAPVNLTLTGVRYGDLTSIGLVVVKNEDITGTGGAGNAKNPLCTQKLENVVLTFNGVVLYRAEGRLLDLQALSMKPTPNFYQYEKATTATSPFTIDPLYQSYYYDLDLSQFSDIISEGNVMSGLEVGSNVLTLSFTTPTANGLACTAFVNYKYPFAIKIGMGGSAVDFVF